MRCRCCESRRVRDAARGRGGRHWGGCGVVAEEGVVVVVEGGGGAGFPLELKLCVLVACRGRSILGELRSFDIPTLKVFCPSPVEFHTPHCGGSSQWSMPAGDRGVDRAGPPKFWSQAQARHRDCRLLQLPPRHPEGPRPRHRNARSAEVTRPCLLPVNMHGYCPPNDSLPPPAKHLHTSPAPLEADNTPGDNPSSPKECLDCDDDNPNRG